MRRILRCLFGGLHALDFHLTLLELQPALEHVTPDAEHHGKADDDQKEGDHVAVHWSFSSVRGATQPLDLLIEQVAAVGDDAFDGREPVFHRAKLGTQLRVLLAQQLDALDRLVARLGIHRLAPRSEEHPSELQSLMRISYAVFCLKKKKKQNDKA